MTVPPGFAEHTSPEDGITLWESNFDNIIGGNISGMMRLNSKKLTKGLAFSTKERQLLGIHGLLPYTVRTLKEQVKHCMAAFDRIEVDLDKYIYLFGLCERNERLYFTVVRQNLAKFLPVVYTPTIGLAVQKYSLIFYMSKGLFITIKDKGHIMQVMSNWPEIDVRAIVVTDGERVLGLGDVGANGMGISVGKLSLYTLLGGIHPYKCLPIMLDVGTNTQTLLDDPLYMGLREKRTKGKAYIEFIDEFMDACVHTYGQNTLIQFEDFSNTNAFGLLARYRNLYCTFNDDIQGTATIAMAGLLTAIRITKTQLKNHIIMFQGAGSAALNIAKLCVMWLKKEGLTDEEARKIIWMCDSKGLVVRDRPKGGLTEQKLEYAQLFEPLDTLAKAVKKVKPTILIGAGAVAGSFTSQILTNMAIFSKMPIIFALSNPLSRVECTAEDAYTATHGKCIFASGTPFLPVQFNNRVRYPSQCNTCHIFPGIALGVLCAGMMTIPEEVFLVAAESLASLVSKDELIKGSVFPPLESMPQSAKAIAEAIMIYAFQNKIAMLRPEPKDKAVYIETQIYHLKYPKTLPDTYSTR